MVRAWVLLQHCSQSGSEHAENCVNHGNARRQFGLVNGNPQERTLFQRNGRIHWNSGILMIHDRSGGSVRVALDSEMSWKGDHLGQKLDRSVWFVAKKWSWCVDVCQFNLSACLGCFLLRQISSNCSNSRKQLRLPGFKVGPFVGKSKSNLLAYLAKGWWDGEGREDQSLTQLHRLDVAPFHVNPLDLLQI